jgi:thymidylate kinase
MIVAHEQNVNRERPTSRSHGSSRPLRILRYRILCSQGMSVLVGELTSQGLPFDFCLNPDKGLPLPDATLYLTLPPDVASARATYGVERYETVAMQERVKSQFTAVAGEVKKRHGEDSWSEISASGTIEEVEGLIHSKLEPLLSGDLKPMGRLWQ